MEIERNNEVITQTVDGGRGQAEPIVGNEGGQQIVNPLLVKEVKCIIKKEIEKNQPKQWFGTQAQYDAIDTPDESVLYFIEEE